MIYDLNSFAKIQRKIQVGKNLSLSEYCCQVPANRIGFEGNGGPFTLVQLKVIQECISLGVFAVIANIMFQGQDLHWNHALAFILIICAVYLVFMK